MRAVGKGGKLTTLREPIGTDAAHTSVNRLVAAAENPKGIHNASHRSADTGGSAEYHILSKGGVDRGGLTSQLGAGAKPYWLPYPAADRRSRRRAPPYAGASVASLSPLIASCQRCSPAPTAAVTMTSNAAFSLPTALTTLATWRSVVRLANRPFCLANASYGGGADGPPAALSATA